MEDSSLSDIVMDSISSYFAAKGGGMVSSFVVVAEVMRADGTVSMTFCCPESQPLFRNLGLLAYGDEWARDDVRNSFLAASLEDDE